MSNAPVRRAQLIAPFGVGSMMTTSEGVTLIMAGLDFWFQGERHRQDLTEFEIADEWRLSEELGVKKFMLPPDSRVSYGSSGGEAMNQNLVIPAFRFPLWSFCPSCYLMYKQEPFQSNNDRCFTCGKSESRKKYGTKTIQVAFIAMCSDGHIQDFPFKEWVHRSVTPECDGRLTLSLSGATLASQAVKCSCGKRRNFEGIFSGSRITDDKSHLSQHLDQNHEYLCSGWRPWLAETSPAGCGLQLFGGVTGSVNNYYAHVHSSIYLPQSADGLSQDLVDLFEGNEFQQFFAIARNLEIETMLGLMDLQGLSARIAPLLHGIPLRTAMGTYLKATEVTHASTKPEDVTLKALEYDFFAKSTGIDSQNLATRILDMNAFAPHSMSTWIDGVVAVDKLRETRALVGFDRLKPQPNRPLSELKRLMSRSGVLREWLPAYEVYGEGIFISFDDAKLASWAERSDVQARIETLKNNPAAQAIVDSSDPTLMARTVAVHTFAHLLINQMVFSSGYAAASLRERVFVTASSGGKPGGNGVLIYTASGDVEGSLGGLVRLSEPGHLEVVIDAALEAARFCSTDPVCMEVGALGQGPDSLNLAACHNCTLLPETSCERFNVLLDRGLVIGTIDQTGIGLVNWG